MIKKEIEAFLLSKRGYLKKSPMVVAQAMWNGSEKVFPKTGKEVAKDLEQIKSMQKILRSTLSEIDDRDKNMLDLYSKALEKKVEKQRRKLFFDIEVSPNLVFSWRIGRDVDLSPENIIKERAIICICYKWDDEEKVHSLKWNCGNDKEMLEKFAKIIDSADEIVTQNGDAFDVKWLRTRCIYYGIRLSPKFNSIDTLKMARAGFKFNSNKLDYMGSFLSLGKKVKTEYDLWKDIALFNDKESMDRMIAYCKQDVVLLEKVYNKLQDFSPVKKFKYKN